MSLQLKEEKEQDLEKGVPGRGKTSIEFPRWGQLGWEQRKGREAVVWGVRRR